MFKCVSGFDGRYTVDPEGNVYSMVLKGNIKETPVCKLRPANNKGYLRVVLRHKGDNTSHGRYVHRLVAEAFIPNPLKLTDVNHIDGDKSNNTVSNLEWCSRKANVEHAWRTGLSTKEMMINTRTKITEYTGVCTQTGEALVFLGSKELEKAGFHRCNVIRVCNGERKQHKGKTWSKKEVDNLTNI